MSKLTSKWVLFFLLNFIYSINILILAQSESVYVDKLCENDFNYTKNSSFQTNLDRALVNLPLTNSGYGFFNSTSGSNPDTANAIGLCRGDHADPVSCRSCVNNSIVKLRQVCPNQKDGSVYYDYCMVRYSGNDILGKTEIKDIITHASETNVTGDAVSFNAEVLKMMENLTAEAASGGSLRKYATGTMTRQPNASTTYGLAQCTPDLSSQQCNDCLKGAVSQIAGCCFGKIGMRVLLPMCNIRYENFQFYNAAPVIPQPPPPPPTSVKLEARKTRSTRIVTSIVMATAALVVIIASVCTFAMWKKKNKLEEIIEETYKTKSTDMSIVESLEYDFCTVRAATNDFSEDNKIGQGGFGSVYKGELEDGRLIAVKRLSRESGQGELEFKNEVLLVAKLHHRNLVGLLGFSIEGKERVLIYEYFPNGSLDKYLFDPNKRTLLEWDNSYKIIEGIARGLLYLHEDSRLRIIHRDLKASNILLDGEMNAKITDFGMARLFNPDETQCKTSRVVGTYGYMAPEYMIHGQFSVKLDVYSFGVLMLEIITGQRNRSFKNKDGDSTIYLLTYAWRSWRDGTASDIIDPILLKGSNSLTDILRSIHIALLCVQKNVVDRPTMSLVVLMLGSFSLTLQVPSEPAFFVHDSVENEVAPINEYDASDEGNRRSGSSHSVNEATISEMNPR